MKQNLKDEKKTKKINGVTRLVTMAAAVFALVVASYAWFVTSQETKTQGIENSVETGENLIIASTASEISNAELIPDDYFTITLNYGKNNMLPATHVDGDVWSVGDEVSETGLMYPENKRYIANNTGLQIDDSLDLGFKPVPLDSRYYVDYDAYIASTNGPIENVSLVARLIASPQRPCHYAASIDFYYGNVSSNSFLGTLNVANQNDTERGILSIPLNNNTVPWNTEDSIHLTLRCYYDGALIDPNSGNAYIRTDDISTESIPITVAFAAADLNN